MAADGRRRIKRLASPWPFGTRTANRSTRSSSIRPNWPAHQQAALHDVVVMYETNRRVGTVMTRNRAQTGGEHQEALPPERDRPGPHGNAPHECPPRRRPRACKYPIDYGYRLPKKAVRLATRMALLSKFFDEEVTLLSELAIGEAKTKNMATLLKALGLSKTSCLLAMETHDANVVRSGRNIPGLRISSCDDLNAYDLLHQKQLILTRGASNGSVPGRRTQTAAKES